MTRLLLDENIGPIRVDFEPRRDGLVLGDMRQNDLIFAARHNPETIASPLWSPVSAFRTNLPIVSVSTGRPNLLMCFLSLAALRSANPD